MVCGGGEARVGRCAGASVQGQALHSAQTARRVRTTACIAGYARAVSRCVSRRVALLVLRGHWAFVTEGCCSSEVTGSPSSTSCSVRQLQPFHGTVLPCLHMFFAGRHQQCWLALLQGHGSHNAMELPHVHDHAEGLPSAGSRLSGAHGCFLLLGPAVKRPASVTRHPLSHVTCPHLRPGDHECEAAAPGCLSL